MAWRQTLVKPNSPFLASLAPVSCSKRGCDAGAGSTCLFCCLADMKAVWRGGSAAPCAPRFHRTARSNSTACCTHRDTSATRCGCRSASLGKHEIFGPVNGRVVVLSSKSDVARSVLRMQAFPLVSTFPPRGAASMHHFKQEVGLLRSCT